MDTHATTLRADRQRSAARPAQPVRARWAQPTRVVLIGAGFGGLAALRELRRRRVAGQIDLTVIDEVNHHTFQPLLYQVATAGLQPQDVAHSIRGVIGSRTHVGFRLGRVVGVDWPRREVRLADGDRVPYDRLVIAAGAVTNDFGVPGVTEHAFVLKQLGDAAALRNHILRRFEEASAHASHPEGTLTFVVVGAGPTGVELSGALAELTTHVLAKDFPELDTRQVRILLVERDDLPLPGYRPRNRRYARARLADRGVEVALATGVREVRGTGVLLNDGRIVASRTVVWAAGVRPHPLAEALDLPLGPGGRIAIDATLRVHGRPEVLAVGDVAAVTEGPEGPHPQLAPVALQQGRHAARELLRERAGEPPRPFGYVDKGKMATIGRSAAVAESPGGRLAVRGFVAWVAWLLLHVAFLVGFRNRASVLFTWAYSYLTYDQSARAVFEARGVADGGP
ncbi:NAD(P)/FAD-dependent oxidoreductase [Egibacter rhizosphaerae]|uniref:NADH:ubiquinone reductase (non-electrogenic) n=1 Tax=Egibacter rhizosphaerae TaxID=1670831 RepID=A0A411YJK4_9ACTN|nr:NAD(P)/FAD-dependent oxidoreductase [Egibacter rhizosphaerae]QBI21329.1 NAD(P)/FAD-dependent oxidoreductase [Egibacter rhizosphaerae]